MKKRVSTRIVVLALALVCLLGLAACGEKQEAAVTPYLPADDGGVFYCYGVVKSQGAYYLQALTEYRERPDPAAYLHIPLAEEVCAYFQDPEWIGAWSPEQYLSAEELAAGHEAGKIAQGAKFTCFLEEGKAVYLEEENYYIGT